jgi:hypothetical protein
MFYEPEINAQNNMSVLKTIFIGLNENRHFVLVGTVEKLHSAFKLFATAWNKIIYSLKEVPVVLALRAIEYMFTLRVRESVLIIGVNDKKRKTGTTFSGLIRPPKVSSRFQHVIYKMSSMLNIS